MFLESVTGAACAAAGLVAYGVRGRSSSLFGPSVWRGASDRPAIALTFDDGPSESTPELLDALARSGVRATFFQCGVNVRRLPVGGAGRCAAPATRSATTATRMRPSISRRPRRSITTSSTAQESIFEASGVRPSLFRAPYGARWFGLRAAQKRLGLLGVMWTAIGRDWVLSGAAVAGGSPRLPKRRYLMPARRAWH